MKKERKRWQKNKRRKKSKMKRKRKKKTKRRRSKMKRRRNSKPKKRIKIIKFVPLKELKLAFLLNKSKKLLLPVIYYLTALHHFLLDYLK